MQLTMADFLTPCEDLQNLHKAVTECSRTRATLQTELSSATKKIQALTADLQHQSELCSKLQNALDGHVTDSAAQLQFEAQYRATLQQLVNEQLHMQQLRISKQQDIASLQVHLREAQLDGSAKGHRCSQLEAALLELRSQHAGLKEAHKAGVAIITEQQQVAMRTLRQLHATELRELQGCRNEEVSQQRAVAQGAQQHCVQLQQLLEQERAQFRASLSTSLQDGSRHAGWKERIMQLRSELQQVRQGLAWTARFCGGTLLPHRLN